MLSRSAQSLYWLGRYLERAQHLCRLLQLQVEALVDRPLSEIYFGWSRLYAGLSRQPPGGDLESGGSDDYTLADSYTLAGDLTFERDNLDSVRNCFALGRENARQVRHYISSEMWTCLNLAWLRLSELDIEDIWKVSPENFYAETVREINTFTGVAEATMYRDEGWRFMRLGRFIERAQLRAALLLAQLAAGRTQGETSDADWTSLLRSCQAFDAYKRSYSVEIQPDQVLDLLVTDPLLPGSLYRALDALAAELAAIGARTNARTGAAVESFVSFVPPGANASTGAAAERLAGRLCALIRYDWPDRSDREALLAQVGEHCRKLHELVTAAYIAYAIEDFPVH